MEEQNNKIPLLLLSGGMDSTYMTQWFLQYGNVDTLYVEANNHPLKLKKEREARAKLFALFEKYYTNKVLHDYKFELNNIYQSYGQCNGVQQISWLTAALSVFDPERHHTLAIGYVLGDQAPAFRQQYEDFWRAGWIMTRGHLAEVPKLVFPILNHNLTKYDVVDRIDKRLVTSTWVCETPRELGEAAHKTIKACGTCRPCRLLKHTIEDWEFDTGKKYMTEVIKAMNPDKFPKPAEQIKEFPKE